MLKRNLISIIIPVYNASAFISNTIYNLLAQEVEKELLLVNDGSTDNSLNILNDYAQKYSCIKVLNQTNQGVSSARNHAIEVAQGEFLIFVDSDDLLEPGTLQKCLNIYHANNDIDCVVFTYKCCKPNLFVFDTKLYKKSGLYTIEQWLMPFSVLHKTSIINCIGTKLYRTSILKDKNIRFNEDISYCEDVGFTTIYLKYVRKLFYINEPLYCYMFVNPNSLMTKYMHNYPMSKKYLHMQQYNLLKEVYGENFPNHEYYRVLALDLYSCLFNEIMHVRTDKNESILRIKEIASLPYIWKSIIHAGFSKIAIILLLFKVIPHYPFLLFFNRLMFVKYSS